MPVTKQELQRTYARKSTPELLIIVADTEGYTPLAREVARDIVVARGLYKEDLEEYQSDRILRMDEAYRRAHFVDIRTYEKFLLYFLCWIMPFFWWFHWKGLSEEGYALKLRQTRLFLRSGLIGFFVMLPLEHVLGTGGAIALWVVGFIGVFLWDRKESAKRKEEYDRIYGQVFGSNVEKHQGGSRVVHR